MKLFFQRLVSLFLLSFSCLIALPASADEPASYNQIVIFGDSLSDNGNLYKTDLGLLPKSPPYYQGRFTNGSAWSDLASTYFAEKNIDIQNYAIGGETVILHNPFDGFLPYTFKDSLNSYYFHTLFKDRSHTLFIIWIGANDYLHGSTDPDKATTEVVQAIQDNIENLIAKGGKNFLVLNLPDLALTPFAVDDPSIQNIHALTTLHNTKLQTAVETLQASHADITIRSLDMYALYNDIIANIDVYNQKYHTHLTNSLAACWTGGYAITKMANDEAAIMRNLEADYRGKLVKNAGEKIDFKSMAHFIATQPDLAVTYRIGQSYKEGNTPCTNPDEHIFWDKVHPSATIHTMMGELIIDTVDQYYHVG